MPRPRNRPSVSEDDYQDIAEDLWMDLRSHELAVGSGRSGATSRMLGEHGPLAKNHQD